MPRACCTATCSSILAALCRAIGRGPLQAKLNRLVDKASKLRKVSLNRLEAATRANFDKQLPLTDEMLHLAGLTRVHYVFLYPDTKDIVLAGPSEGWARDAVGHPVGLETGRPILELQDLIVALRAFPPAGKPTPLHPLLDRSNAGRAAAGEGFYGSNRQ